MLMGFLEEMHSFSEDDVNEVIRDIAQEYQLPDGTLPVAAVPGNSAEAAPASGDNPGVIDERMIKMEKSMVSVLSILKKIVSSLPASNQSTDKAE